MERAKSKGVDLRLVVYLLLVVSLSLLLIACSKKIELHWREEVKLSNGSVIWIDREAFYTRQSKEFGIFGGEGGAMVNMMLRVKVPTNNVASPPPVWEFNAVPIILDYDKEKHTWFIVATLFYCNSSVIANNPPFSQWQYEVVDSKWVIVPLSKELLGRSSNLFVSFDNERVKLKEIFLKDIEQDKKNLHSDMYKKVINVANRCYKG